MHNSGDNNAAGSGQRIGRGSGNGSGIAGNCIAVNSSPMTPIGPGRQSKWMAKMLKVHESGRGSESDIKARLISPLLRCIFTVHNRASPARLHQRVAELSFPGSSSRCTCHGSALSSGSVGQACEARLPFTCNFSQLTQDVPDIAAPQQRTKRR
jgi:hypothetical protein